MKNGKYIWWGLGPGDYRLISLKAVDCIRAADTIVYDRLADSRLLRERSQTPNLFMSARLPVIIQCARRISTNCWWIKQRKGKR